MKRWTTLAGITLLAGAAPLLAAAKADRRSTDG